MVKLLVVAGALYLLVVALFFVAQTSLLFPARMAGGAGPLPPGAERLRVKGPRGEELHGAHVPPRRPGAGSKPVILGFGGNAWNADAVAAFLHDLYPDLDVVAFHYRGYRPSSGSPSAAALLADAPLLHDFVAERLGGRPIVAVGFSIGTGVAAHLAGQRPLAGVILVTPFDSLEALASDRYRWMPVALLLRHRMNPIEDLHGTQAPVAIIAAERDTLIPVKHAQRLAKAVPNLVLERVVPDAGHNDIYQHPAFAPTMAEALRKIDGQK